MTAKENMSIREMVLGALFTALIAVGAFLKVTIPVQPFPMHFTMQFFFVLLSGFVLGSRMGCISVVCYLVIGLAGVPIFAAGGGIGYLIRPTFGFLLGFAFAAYITGKVMQKRERHTYGWLLFSAVCGLIAMYLSGMVYFYVISNYVINMPVSWKLVFINCFLLTVSGDLVLCFLAAAAARRILPVLSRLQS